MEWIDCHICSLSRRVRPIAKPVTKIGGKPVVLEKLDWPRCRTCDAPMNFLAQVRLDDPVPLSQQYQMAYVFMCPARFDSRGMQECETWDASAGCNAVILQTGTTGKPDATEKPRYPDYAVKITAAREPNTNKAHCHDCDTLLAIRMETEIGGVPAWEQGDETPICPNCGGTTRFAFQLHSILDGPLPAYLPEEYEAKYQFFDFGDVGIGYVFLCEHECGPRGAALIWQCG